MQSVCLRTRRERRPVETTRALFYSSPVSHILQLGLQSRPQAGREYMLVSLVVERLKGPEFESQCLQPNL